MNFFSYQNKIRDNFFLRVFLIFILVSIFSFASLAFCAKAYPGALRTEISKSKLRNIAPGESISLGFSTAVFPSRYNSGIKVFPQENVELVWADSNRSLKIIPKKFWKPGSQYEIWLPAGRNILFFPVAEQKIIFTVEAYPEILSVSPPQNATNVTVDIEDPIVINFKKSTVNYYLKFLLNKEENLSVQNNVGKTEFKLLSKKELQYAQTYKLEILVKYAKDQDNNYEKIYESSFTTAPPPQISWDKNHAIRLEQAKKYTQAKINAPKYIDINLSAQVLSLFENGKIIDSFMISSGKRGMDTPKGETQIYNKFPRAYSRAYGLYMPFWMAFKPDGKYGLHELPEWPNGYKEGAFHLGIPVSHGCVRLGVGAATRVYEWSEVGTKVVIY